MLEGHSDKMRATAFTPDGGTVVSGGSNGVLASYDTATGEGCHGFIGHTGDVWAVAPSPDGRWLVSGGADQTVRLWDLATGELLLTIFPALDETGGNGWPGPRRAITRRPSMATGLSAGTSIRGRIASPCIILRSASPGDSASPGWWPTILPWAGISMRQFPLPMPSCRADCG
uniref:WD domain-containing protein, G-beta repeat-containing protein n=1 Tax=Candidatus Kentrum sp. LFY TaxID=2126342 RepID=A0A450U9S0_9GAMM|nr:MAG: WD domain-containing protein, G-beta repeat-containing protein [Candidatus Kentron sp. LFY]